MAIFACDLWGSFEVNKWLGKGLERLDGFMLHGDLADRRKALAGFTREVGEDAHGAD